MHMSDFVSSAEFTRWMSEQSDFRMRLESRIGAQHSEVVSTLRRIEDQVNQTNGRTRANGEAIAGLTVRLVTIEAENEKVESIAQSIRDEGCSQLAAHQTLLQGGTPSDWSPRKKAAVVGGILAGGSLVWPAVSEFVKLANEVIHHFAGTPPV